MNDLEQVLFSPHANASDFARLRGMTMSRSDLRHVAERVMGLSMRLRAEAMRDLQLAKGTFTREMGDGLGLRKAGETIGVQYQGFAFTPGVSPTTDAGSLAPLVPQSMDGKLTDMTPELSKSLWMWNHINKNPVYGLVHERAVQTQTTNRPYKSNFIAEGGGGDADLNATGLWQRRSVTIRFESDRDQITDAAMLVRSATETGFVNRGAMEVVRKASLARLLKGRERNLWLGNNTCNPLSYDGFYTSVGGLTYSSGHAVLTTDQNRVGNLAGAQLTFDKLLAICEAKATPIVGQSSEIRHIAMLPQAYASLVKQAQSTVTTFVPGAGPSVVNGVLVQYFPGRITMMASYGEVEIAHAPLMLGETVYNYNTTSGGTAPTGLSGITSIAAAPNASSLFTSGDAGNYYYRITGVNANGESAPYTSTVVSVAAGDSVSIVMNDNGTNAQYYNVERTAVGGAATATRFIGQWPVNTAGAGSKTLIIDDNIFRPFCSPVAFLTGRPSDYEWESLLPVFFKPLAQTATAVPFLMLDFGAPFWTTPELQYLLLNAGFAS